MRTKNHPLYIPPSREDVQTRFREIGFTKPYSHDLVKDIANAYSYIMQGNNVTDCFVDSGNKYTQAVHNLLENTDFSKLSGRSPLEKAASLICNLTKIRNTGRSRGGEGETLPIFEKNSSEEIQEKLEKIQEDVEAVREAGEIAAHSMGVNCVESMDRYDLKRNKGFLDNLALLNSKKFLQASKVTKKVFNRRMSEYSQVSNLSNFSSVGMPTYKYKLASKQLNVRVRKQANVQSLFLLIDDSGSMDCDDKNNMLQALLVNRLQAVADGKAVLYIATFVGDMSDKIITVDSKAKAIKYANWFPNLNGGNTNVRQAVKSACKIIQSGKINGQPIKGENPEIVVINDGDDYVDDFTPSIKTHGIILGQDNDGMKQMINKSGGEYKRFL
jgi:hypothetical protein